MNKAKFDLEAVRSGEHIAELNDGTKLESLTLHEHIVGHTGITLGACWQKKNETIFGSFSSTGKPIGSDGRVRKNDPNRLVSMPKGLGGLEGLIARYWKTKAAFASDCGVTGSSVTYWLKNMPERALMHMEVIVKKTGLTPNEVYQMVVK